MNRKNEENLIKLAFGDMDPQEAERAKRMLLDDAEAQKLFEGYAEIREGLKQLPCPSHQLSTERLRDAILKDGLKKEKSGSGWRWSLAPVAVAAAAMLITLRVGQQTNVLPAVMEGGTPVAASKEQPIDFTPSVTSSEPIRITPRDIVRETSRAAVSGATHEVARRIQAPAPAAKMADTGTLAVASHRDEGAAKPEVKTALSPEDVSNLAIDGALPAGAVALSFDAAGEQPIVLIGAESDESTGANRATEVNTANNVIVGG